MSDKINGTFTLKITSEQQERVEKVSRLARRKRSDTARLLLTRALDMFEIDGKIDQNMPPILFKTTPQKKPVNPSSPGEGMPVH